MTLHEYELAARRTMNGSLSERDRLLDAAAGLAEEAGEVLGAVRKNLFQQRPLDVAHVREELGDALWCLAAVAHGVGLELEDVATANLAKLKQRYPEDA